MTKVECTFCRLPFRVAAAPEKTEAIFCCSGCALAAQMRIEGGQFPVTPQLVVNLVAAFGVFNQALGIVFGLALIAEGRTPPGEASLLASIGLGGVLFFGTLLWQMRLRWLRKTDRLLFAALALLIAPAVFFALRGEVTLGALLALAANVVLTGWQYRGFVRRFFVRLRG